jgi:tetratricopeptide (TPR) repeat protein
VIAAALLLLAALVARGRGTTSQPVASGAWETTSHADLARTAETMSARLDQDASDATAAVALAEALLRLARVDNDPAHAVRAERALRRALDTNPRDYLVRRELGAVLLSQHRFREAITEAKALQRQRPDDVWNDGVIGDAHLELGDYDAAFDAFDRMVAVRPNAAAYARVSYARELQGDREGAIRLMAMSLEATSAKDPESQAWHEVQLGQLTLDSGDVTEARRHFDRAQFLFPGYGPAIEGQVRVLISERRLDEALALAVRQLASRPTGTLAILAGDVARALGRHEDEARHYAEAERLLQYEPAALALFLADRNRDVTRAVEIAKAAASIRHDIFTEDALAWSLFKAGRHTEALTTIQRALRTGSRDRRLLAHAAAIHLAVGDIRRRHGYGGQGEGALQTLAK